jgi:hypothetical protein
MKQLIAFFALAFLLISTKGFCQKVSKTIFGIGINQLQSIKFNNYYDDECSPPTFLTLGVSHFWYRADKKITFNKEIGLDLQYSSPKLSSGGLGGHSYSKSKLLNLFAEATIQAQIKIDNMMSVGIGPVAEYLILEYNEQHSSYYMMTNPPMSGEYNHSGINRDYFGDPLYGVRLSILNSNIGDRATFKFNLSYFWMKENESNFHSSNYLKFGMAIGFMHKKALINSNDE